MAARVPKRASLAVLAVTITFGLPLAGQRLRPSTLSPKGANAIGSEITTSGIASINRVSLRLFPPVPDHRYEGGVIGVVTFAALGAYLGHALCEHSEAAGNCTSAAIGVGVGGGVCGALIGGLVGSRIPKSRSAP